MIFSSHYLFFSRFYAIFLNFSVFHLCAFSLFSNILTRSNPFRAPLFSLFEPKPGASFYYYATLHRKSERILGLRFRFTTFIVFYWGCKLISLIGFEIFWGQKADDLLIYKLSLFRAIECIQLIFAEIPMKISFYIRDLCSRLKW